jgi:hypothetical protein
MSQPEQSQFTVRPNNWGDYYVEQTLDGKPTVLARFASEVEAHQYAAQQERKRQREWARRSTEALRSKTVAEGPPITQKGGRKKRATKNAARP